MKDVCIIKLANLNSFFNYENKSLDFRCMAKIILVINDEGITNCNNVSKQSLTFIFSKKDVSLFANFINDSKISLYNV